MRPLRRFHLALVVLAALLSAAMPASAQDVAAAEALFNRGLQDMKAGRYDAGCKAIAESQSLDPRPGTLFTLATCEEQWGHVATASTLYGDYLALYDRLPADRKAAQGERPKVARDHRAKLAPEVPELTLLLPADAPATTVVTRDGQVMAAAALGVGLPVDPGEHTLVTHAPGRPEWTQTIMVGRGEKKRVFVEVKPAPMVSVSSTAVPLPERDTGPSKQRVAVYVVGGLGVVGLALGGVMGGLTLGKKGVLQHNCGAAVGRPADPGACNATGLDAASSASTLGLASTLGFAVGGAGVGTALVLFLTEPKSGRPTPTTGTETGGRWLSAGVVSLGREATEIGVQGVW